MRLSAFLRLFLFDDVQPQVLILGRDLLREHRFEIIAVVHLEDGEHAPLSLVEKVFGAGLRVCQRASVVARKGKKRDRS